MLVTVVTILAIRNYNEAQHQKEINQRLENTQSRTQKALQGTSEALRATQKEKMGIESSLKTKTQESDSRQQEIENLQRQLQSRKQSKIILASATKQTYTGSDVWASLAQCESGGNWSINTGNGFYGGLQFDIQTWGGYGGYSRADLAPPSVQVEKGKEVHSRRGFSPWPSCKAQLGL